MQNGSNKDILWFYFEAMTQRRHFKQLNFYVKQLCHMCKCHCDTEISPKPWSMQTVHILYKYLVYITSTFVNQKTVFFFIVLGSQKLSFVTLWPVPWFKKSSQANMHKFKTSFEISGISCLLAWQQAIMGIPAGLCPQP